jgi:hypothetical protein
MPAPKKASKPKAAEATKAKAEKPKAEKSKTAAPQAAKPAEAGVSAIDPTKSAAHAAAMVAQNANQPAPPSTPAAPQAESALFRNMKNNLNKPHSQIMGGLLDKLGSSQPKKSSQPFTGGNQVGHGQTIGADATRRNVPRRTGG